MTRQGVAPAAHRSGGATGARLVITGGGTGGHVYPALALAEEARRRGLEVLYVGTRRGLEAKLVPALAAELGFRFQTVAAAGFMGRPVWRQLLGLGELAWGVFQALWVLRRERASLVIGMGGYVAAPVLLAAWLSKIPSLLCEQNVRPGMANALLGRVARAWAVAFPETAARLPGRRAVVTGNPVRRSICEAGLARRRRGSPPRPPALLVFGGSQGARSINRAMVEALPLLRARADGVRITHQTGPRDQDWVAEAYGRAGVAAQVVTYIDDMASACLASSLVVCRAGATSVAELTVMGLPAILVPYPHAAHGHQEENARGLVAHGAALMIRDAELSGARLAAAIDELLDDPPRRCRMSACSRALGKPDAAASILELCADLLGLPPAPREG
ncbi:MAG: undecaprenyldiphospho-muramoylpentapeptide beta-N-acetylglucosaminyltransferase [Candidatus Tectomicrobia bacterium]|nr:undecaprenyldiphospho-muramoylpentapeptide beta-N-acetylglucosaminyltransferase [Candidatus Tectomicrobia bacterium]